MKVEKQLTLELGYQSEWRAWASTEGGAIEIECLQAPETALSGGEWELIYVRSGPNGGRKRLLKKGKTARTTTFKSSNGVLGFLRRLGLTRIEVPLIAGEVERTEFPPTGATLGGGEDEDDA